MFKNKVIIITGRPMSISCPCCTDNELSLCRIEQRHWRWHCSQIRRTWSSRRDNPWQEGSSSEICQGERGESWEWTDEGRLLSCQGSLPVLHWTESLFQVHIVSGDISKETVRQRLILETVDKFGRLDVLVSSFFDPLMPVCHS